MRTQNWCYSTQVCRTGVGSNRSQGKCVLYVVHWARVHPDHLNLKMEHVYILPCRSEDYREIFHCDRENLKKVYHTRLPPIGEKDSPWLALLMCNGYQKGSPLARSLVFLDHIFMPRDTGRNALWKPNLRRFKGPSQEKLAPCRSPCESALGAREIKYKRQRRARQNGVVLDATQVNVLVSRQAWETETRGHAGAWASYDHVHNCDWLGVESCLFLCVCVCVCECVCFCLCLCVCVCVYVCVCLCVCV